MKRTLAIVGLQCQLELLQQERTGPCAVVLVSWGQFVFQSLEVDVFEDVLSFAVVFLSGHRPKGVSLAVALFEERPCWELE